MPTPDGDGFTPTVRKGRTKNKSETPTPPRALSRGRGQERRDPNKFSPLAEMRGESLVRATEL